MELSTLFDTTHFHKFVQSPNGSYICTACALPMDAEPSLIESNGNAHLSVNSSNLVSVVINGATTAVKFNRRQLTADQFNDRELVAAETINGENRILWREISTGKLRTWLLNSSWNFVNNNNPLVDPNSTQGILLQEQFGLTSTPPPAADNNNIVLKSSLDLSKTFLLHSNPTATKTIFLDFDGHTVNNTPWERGGDLQVGGFYSSFDSKARTEIQRIWQRVAEDFAPFNVNVTTEDPGSEALSKTGTGDDRWGIRVAFTKNLNLLTGNSIQRAGGGGSAWYDSFNWDTDDVALVFNRGEYAAAETASHEIGHALNLRHDGLVDWRITYYPGHGGTGPTSWGTIMGASWQGANEVLTQWSKGEYSLSNNTEDDLAIITTGNGFGYRDDDHGNTFATATALTGLTFSSFGVIERNTDIDMFRFETGAGQVSFNIVNASRAFIGSAGSYVTEYLTSRGPNLDIGANLYRADGSLLQTFNPPDDITASFSINLDAGTYYLGIEGVGFGNPFASTPTGYTDYGSLGQYMVTGTVQSTTATPPPPPEPPLPPITSTLQVLDPNGTVQLLRDTSTDLVSVQINGVTSAVRLSGSQVKASQFADRKILAAETINGQNQILWQVVSTGQIRTWSLDSRWNFVSSSALADPTSTQGLLFQQQFMVSLADTPTTPQPPVIFQIVDPNGVVQLLRNTDNNQVSVQVGETVSAVRLSGTQVRSNQFADRKILAAETINGRNQILWKVVSTGQIRTWTLDSKWNFISSDNNLADPTSSAGLLLQQQFMVDATGTPLASAPLDAATEAIDPITGLEQVAIFVALDNPVHIVYTDSTPIIGPASFDVPNPFAADNSLTSLIMGTENSLL